MHIVSDFCFGHFFCRYGPCWQQPCPHNFCHIFDRIDLKLCRMFCNDLKMCIWFWILIFIVLTKLWPFVIFFAYFQLIWFWSLIVIYLTKSWPFVIFCIFPYIFCRGNVKFCGFRFLFGQYFYSYGPCWPKCCPCNFCYIFVRIVRRMFCNDLKMCIWFWFLIVIFLCPRRNFGWHIKIAPSVRQSIRPLQIVSQRYLINYWSKFVETSQNDKA